MEVVCGHCSRRFKISDEKLPSGKTIATACPKCKNKIVIHAPQKHEHTGEGSKPASDDIVEGSYDASEKPFDFVEKEGKTALVCESDSTVKKAIFSALSSMQYHVTDARDISDALRCMRYHVYDLVLVDESFGSEDPGKNDILTYLRRLPMEIRRKIFVTLISGRYRTFDNMMAFKHSVNLILNVENADAAEKILVRAIADNDLFYRVFKDSLKSTGRI
ncbi:MAG: hypothetical protein JRH18_10650 [Deltaproteobacteria bacterium]|nr:hypothetical protein [Deltaproteobacteria bacterium]MBW2152114.1 hypothetical protein [Deltaproteobacteria bacterium]